MDTTAAAPPTYEQLAAENQALREHLAKNQQQVLAEVIEALLSDDEPLVRVKPEAYEYRIYELELDYMFQLAGTPESQAARESMERVKANYLCDYPERPLNPKPRPSETPDSYTPPYFGPARKERKPYTRKVKAA